ncbi:MAG: hypothetical protein ACUVUD_01600 [bacterium]
MKLQLPITTTSSAQVLAEAVNRFVRQVPTDPKSFVDTQGLF